MSMTAPVPFVVDKELRVVADKFSNDLEGTSFHLRNREQLIREIGIAAAVQNMVYTDIAPEYVAKDKESIQEGIDQPTLPQDIRHEISVELSQSILDFGGRFQLSKDEKRQAWLVGLQTVDKIVRASFSTDKTSGMEDVDVEMDRIAFEDE